MSAASLGVEAVSFVQLLEVLRVSEPETGGPGPTVELDKKAVFGWAMFDFANSSFTTVMITAFFSLYFMNEVVPASSDGTDRGPALWGLAVAISQTIVILTAPLLGALAVWAHQVSRRIQCVASNSLGWVTQRLTIGHDVKLGKPCGEPLENVKGDIKYVRCKGPYRCFRYVGGGEWNSVES